MFSRSERRRFYQHSMLRTIGLPADKPGKGPAAVLAGLFVVVIWEEPHKIGLRKWLGVWKVDSMQSEHTLIMQHPVEERVRQILDVCKEALAQSVAVSDTCCNVPGGPAKRGKGVALNHAARIIATRRLDDRIVRIASEDFELFDFHSTTLPSTNEGIPVGIMPSTA